MSSRWLDPDRTMLVVTRECDGHRHDECPVSWPGGECGCACHLSNATAR
jgi:hypothetical protein